MEGDNDTPVSNALTALHGAPISMGRGETPVELQLAAFQSALRNRGDLLKASVPVWEKTNLTLEEAAAYYNIGINKLREMTDTKECERYVLWVGNKRLIKRVPFEKYLMGEYSI